MLSYLTSIEDAHVEFWSMLGCSSNRSGWLSSKCVKSFAFFYLLGLTLTNFFGFFSDFLACCSDNFLYIWKRTFPSTDTWLVFGLPPSLGKALGDALGDAFGEAKLFYCVFGFSLFSLSRGIEVLWFRPRTVFGYSLLRVDGDTMLLLTFSLVLLEGLFAAKSIKSWNASFLGDVVFSNCFFCLYAI